jgi:hypothetical protein
MQERQSDGHWRHGPSEMEETGRWPCGVCCKGVRSNALAYTRCKKWVHKRGSDVKGSLQKVSEMLVCKICLGKVKATVTHKGMNIGN